MRTKVTLGGLLLACLCSVLSAWTYEQLEPTGDWSWVETEVMPGGTICVCYQDSATGQVLVARKDSMWHRDDLGQWTGTVGHHLVVGPAQEPAVLLESDTVTVYAALTDTGWSFTAVHCTTGYTFLAFDNAGNPALFYYYVTDGGEALHGLSSAYERGGVWTTDTIELGYDDGFFRFDPGPPTTFVLGSENVFYNDREVDEGYTQGGEWRYVDTGRTGAWEHAYLVGGEAYWVEGRSMAPGPSSEFAICYDLGYWGQHSRFYCNDDTVETLPAGPSRVRIDSRGLRQIVYYLGVMKYAYRTSRWHIDTLPPEINTASSFDFALDQQNRPLIAYTSAAGVYLASGDAVGVEEQKSPPIRSPLFIPSIVHGVLLIPPAGDRSPFAANLLDITGRKVCDLKPGANDVSRLAPGVYFIRGLGSRVSALRTQKVVLTR